MRVLKRCQAGSIICILSFFCLLLAGCMHSTETDAEQSVEMELQEEQLNYNNYIVVGFVQVGSESDWRTANTESYTSVFTEENGYYLILEDGQQKQENQIKSMRSLILQQVDYIILDPIVETGWDAVLQEAKDAGIPVIIADRMVDVEDDDLYTCWIGSDFYQEGKSAAEWLAKYLEETDEEKAGTGGDIAVSDDSSESAETAADEEMINIVVLQGTLGSTSQLGRTNGFADVAATASNWNILESQSGDFTQSKGKEVMEYFLETYEDIDVIVSENDNMTFGALEAIWEAGRTCGPDGEIIVISFDAVSDAIQEIVNGNINAVFECNPLLGPFVEEIIQDLEAGKEVEKIQYVEETYFDSTMDLETILEERLY